MCHCMLDLGVVFKAQNQTVHGNILFSYKKEYFAPSRITPSSLGVLGYPLGGRSEIYSNFEIFLKFRFSVRMESPCDNLTSNYPYGTSKPFVCFEAVRGCLSVLHPAKLKFPNPGNGIQKKCELYINIFRCRYGPNFTIRQLGRAFRV